MPSFPFSSAFQVTTWTVFKGWKFLDYFPLNIKINLKFFSIPPYPILCHSPLCWLPFSSSTYHTLSDLTSFSILISPDGKCHPSLPPSLLSNLPSLKSQLQYHSLRHNLTSLSSSLRWFHIITLLYRTHHQHLLFQSKPLTLYVQNAMPISQLVSLCSTFSRSF